MKTLGQFIRETRNGKDISLREFAKEVDVSPAFLSDIELGRRFPSNENLEKIAKSLKVSVSILKEYDSRPPAEDLRLLTRINPDYAFAFRAMVDSGVTPQAIMELAKKERDKNKSSKK